MITSEEDAMEDEDLSLTECRDCGHIDEWTAFHDGGKACCPNCGATSPEPPPPVTMDAPPFQPGDRVRYAARWLMILGDRSGVTQELTVRSVTASDSTAFGPHWALSVESVDGREPWYPNINMLPGYLGDQPLEASRSLADRLSERYRNTVRIRDQHHNGTDTPGDDPGWAYYNGYMDGLARAAKDIGVPVMADDGRHGPREGLRAVDLQDDGLLWLINRCLFHRIGYALAVDPDGGLHLAGDGSEEWVYSEDLRKALGEREAAARWLFGDPAVDRLLGSVPEFERPVPPPGSAVPSATEVLSDE